MGQQRKANAICPYFQSKCCGMIINVVSAALFHVQILDNLPAEKKNSSVTGMIADDTGANY